MNAAGRTARLADAHYGGVAIDLAVRGLAESGRQLAANDENPLHITLGMKP
jgi:hypothetical protein